MKKRLFHYEARHQPLLSRTALRVVQRAGSNCGDEHYPGPGRAPIASPLSLAVG
jgi:hypothetical protein